MGQSVKNESFQIKKIMTNITVLIFGFSFLLLSTTSTANLVLATKHVMSYSQCVL